MLQAEAGQSLVSGVWPWNHAPAWLDLTALDQGQMPCHLPCVSILSVFFGVQFGNVEPAVVEGEGAGVAGRILDADDTGAVHTRPLDHIQPVRIGVCTGAIELRSGQSSWSVGEAASHCLDFAPPCWLLIRSVLVEIGSQRCASGLAAMLARLAHVARRGS